VREIVIAHIEEIAQHEGRSVTLRGWLHNRRSSGKIHFLTVRDGTGFIQAVMSKAAVGEEVFLQAGHLGQETAVVVEGEVRADARAPGGYELDVIGMRVIGPTRDYPITPKEHGVDFLLDRRHLWIRSERQHAILRIRHTVINAVRDFLNTQGFPLLRPRHRVPDTERSAVQRSQRDGTRARVLFRSDVPGREIQDPPSPD